MAMNSVRARDVAAKHGAEKLVLVASRRTDMPRFHLDEIIDGLNTGVFHPQPLMNPVFELAFTPGEIHSVGLWSQDYSLWLDRRGEVKYPYRYWYRFTLLPDDPAVKPVAPPLAEQLRQIKILARADGPDAVNVCIDPLFRYRPIGESEWRDPFTPEFLDEVMRGCSAAGITRVTISLIDYYRKVEERACRFGIEFFYTDKKTPGGIEAGICMGMKVKSAAGRYGIGLRSCCEPGLVDAGIARKGSCTDGRLLNSLFGAGASERPDPGQRRKAGCGCTLSMDIGRYAEYGPMSHHCGHDCPQCYARR
ncbi:MAG TPA: DUF1848 family protein [Spirochaetota bacterium]|nr:DUF1848 family protein [Spirochaetota bacterium]HSA13694.1 DUF1848 family protein [Spirochaetota bacterium]